MTVKLLFKQALLWTALLLATAVMSGCTDVGPEPGPTPDEKPDTETLAEKIKALDGVTQVKALLQGTFDEKYEVMLTQPLDALNPSLGTFSQRVVVMHTGYDRPTLLITEGYDAERGLKSSYADELSASFDMNVIVVEHRYFGKSRPEPLDWRYLTAENSANDLHRIRTLFASLYPKKWAATGVSKGGTTTLIYATYFPNDVDVYVPYVAPVCNAVEDSRFLTFFEEVIPASIQNLVEEFQVRLFNRKEALLPMLEQWSKSNGCEYRVPLSELYDYWVLEYAFSFWQWGFGVKDIPSQNASDSEIFKAWVSLADPVYFATVYTLAPSFVQDVRELGYYPYNLEPFREYASITTTDGYLSRLMLPEELRNETFTTALYEKITTYLQQNDPRMILVYGEYDPWSAPGVAWCVTPEKRNMKAYIVPGGNHTAVIGLLPDDERNQATATLREWLEI